MSEDTRSDLLQRFVAGPERIRQAIGAASDAALAAPGWEGWSAKDVVIHLADAEVLRGIRLRLILGGSEAPLPIFDQDAWRDRLAYGSRDSCLALATYEATIVASHELVRAYGEGAWSLVGLHPEEGPLSVSELIRRGANHAEEHAAQLHALLGSAQFLSTAPFPPAGCGSQQRSRPGR
jgi:hypothetical protein